MGSPLTIFVPHAVEAVLNSHHAQHFSGNYPNFYEVLLLTDPHITLLHGSNLNPHTLLPYVTNEILYDCLMLMDHLLTPCNDL